MLVLLSPCDGNPCAWFSAPSASRNASCRPSDLLQASSLHMPIFILTADRDTTCPPDEDAARVFTAARNASLSLIRRGTHCFTQLPFPVAGSGCNQASEEDGASLRLRTMPIDGATTVSDSLLGPPSSEANLPQSSQLAIARRYIAAAFLSVLPAGRERQLEASRLSFSAGKSESS